MSKQNTPDFSGWVTKNNILCEDGVVITHYAFQDSDGAKVPLVWGHDYNSPENVLGYMLLHKKPHGVYGDAYFNATDSAKHAKEMVLHGDIGSLSIGARKVKRNGRDVVGGEIYEVSLVLKGANPGAVIEQTFVHSADGLSPEDDKVIIYTDLEQEFTHGADLDDTDNSSSESEDSDKNQNENEETMDKTVEEFLNELTPEQSAAAAKMLEEGAEALTEEEAEVLGELSQEGIDLLDTLSDIIDEMVDEEEADYEEEDVADEVEEDETEEGDDDVKHNAFYGEEQYTMDDLNNVVKHAAVTGATSLTNAITQSGVIEPNEDILQHGIANADVLFPTTQLQRGVQVFNPGGQNVDRILGMFSATPKGRVKNIYADLTEKTAKARNYIKGDEKLSQNLISMYYRETTPTTIYVKSDLDRDDILDIQENGIDAVNFQKQVTVNKLKETIVNLALFGDTAEPVVGSKPNPEYVSPQNIRPITKDEDLFTIKVTAAKWENLVDEIILAFPAYQGSGSPVAIMNPFDIAKLQVLKDKDGRYLYGSSGDGNRQASDSDLARHLRVTEIIPYNNMSQGTVVIGNLGDYQFGNVGGQQIASFEHFDIDFNRQKQLAESRLSGATLFPRSFIVASITDKAEVDASRTEFSKTGLKAKADFTVETNTAKAEPKSKAAAPAKPGQA